jgi:hypothetical protein
MESSTEATTTTAQTMSIQLVASVTRGLWAYQCGLNTLELQACAGRIGLALGCKRAHPKAVARPGLL